MRLIDADAAEAEIEKFLYPAPNFDAAYYNDGVNDALREIEDAETVDAVPVVRCKDCKYTKKLLWTDNSGAYYLCGNWMSDVNGNDFCFRAEEREGDG